MLAIFESVAYTIIDGVIQPAANAEIEVRYKDTGGLVPAADLFEDPAGASPKSANPFSADSLGRFFFYTDGRDQGYRVKVTKDAFTYQMESVAIGNAAQRDITAYAATLILADDAPAALFVLRVPPAARASNTILGVDDIGALIVATGTFTQTLTAAATLGAGWWCPYRNDGAGVITIDPNGAELIDGQTTIALQAGQACVIFCDGVGFKTVGRLSLPTSAVITKRQTARLGAVDANGCASFLSAGAGLNFNIDASPTPLVLDFAAGSVDFTSTVSADASNQGTLQASNTNYVYATHVDSASVTWGNCLIPPQYEEVFDKGAQSLLRFDGADGATTIIDDFGATWTASGNAQLDTAQKASGTASLLLDGTGDYVSTSDIKSFGDGSWEISVKFRFPALPSSGTRNAIVSGQLTTAVAAVPIQFGIFNNAGTSRIELYLSSNGTSHDIVNGTVGANTTWTLNQWNRLRLVFDALAGTYKLYLSLNGAAETTDISVSSSARVCKMGGVRLGTNNDATGSFYNGWLDDFRLLRCATKTVAETPSMAVAPVVTDFPVHFFSVPAMTMYEVTAASVAAGTNPTLTARNRVFVGEQDTNATVVTASRTYALRGRYRSPITASPNGDTRTLFAANLGVMHGVRTVAKYLSGGGVNSGQQGDEFEMNAYAAGADDFTGPCVFLRSRGNSLFLNSGDTGLLIFNSAGGPAGIHGLNGVGDVYVEAERTW